VHALSNWPDEVAFQDADPRRRTSSELDLGATWRWAGSNDAWRLAWLRSTGSSTSAGPTATTAPAPT
jgi:hypothetical protein